MEDKYEVLLTSDTSGIVGNISVWNHTTGSFLHQFKGNTSAINTVCQVGSDYVLSAPPDKPLLNVWQVNRSEQLPLRLFTPGPVSAMTVSPSGNYLVASVEENINIWQVSTGALLGVVTRHYQPVTVLRFTQDSSHFISGGADGQVLVWPLVLCVARRPLPGQEKGQVGQVEPRHTWTQHALSVTGIHVGHGVAHGTRVLTSSLDMTVKLFSVKTGHLLLSVSFTVPITAVTMDNMETTVYAGSNNGDIHTFSLLSPPRDVAVTADRMAGLGTWSSHKDAITKLSLSMDACTLASGGQDSNVHLWDTPSGQIIRSLQHKSKVTHVQFIATPPALINKDLWNPRLKLVALQKGSNPKEFFCAIFNKNDPHDSQDWMLDKSAVPVEIEESVNVEEHTVQELKQINNQLYKFALKNVLS